MSNQKSKKMKYQVHLTYEKTIDVFAFDEEDAQEKAEQKLNKKSNKWISNNAWLVQG
jgi:hypothetical protein